jgi:hypothetical protein
VKPVESDTISVDGLSAKMVTKVGQNISAPGFLCSNGIFDINVLECRYGFPLDESYSYFNGYAMYNPTDTDKGPFQPHFGNGMRLHNHV